MKKVLQIRTSTNKLQLSSPINSQLVRKQSQVNLPPINSTLLGESQKTLLVVLKNMQTYAQLHPGNISKLLNDCLNSIYKGFPEVCNDQQNLSLSLIHPIHKKMAQSTETATPTEQLVSKSQLMNVKRTQLKKVESRKLFEKAKAANYQGVMIKSDKQAISKLKRQIAETSQQLAKATSKIEQLEKTVQNNKKYAQQAVSAMISYQQNVNRQINKNKKLQSQIQNLKEEITLLKESFSKDIKRSIQQIQSLKIFLEQRENQVKSLWILCRCQAKND